MDKWPQCQSNGSMMKNYIMSEESDSHKNINKGRVVYINGKGLFRVFDNR